MGLLSNIVHGVLDVAGFIPGVGAVADLANAAIYAAEGDWGNAAMSALSAIPGIGDTMALASKGAKVAKGLKGLSALGKGKALLKGMKGKLFKSLKGLAKDGASFLKKLNPKKLFKGIKKEKKKVCVSGKCFTEDTLVCTPDGYVIIRDIKEGDFVCSRDELTGKTGYKRVTSISRTKAHTVYTVKIDGNTEIKATAYHPFYVEERGWVNVINLLEGDRLVTEEGTSVITSICKERHEEPVIMYNFHVEDWVSYFVSELKVYVHNGHKHLLKVSEGNGKVGTSPDNSMYRKVKNPSAIEPMPKRQLNKIVKAFKRQGGIIQMDDATDLYLQSKHAEGITYDAKTILLRQKPGRASVYEELIHASQYRQGLNDGSLISRIQNEISAQEMLLRNSQAYKLTPVEISQTQSALNSYINQLQGLLGGQ